MTQTSNDAQRGIDRREALRRAALVLGGALSTSTIAGVLAGCEARRTPDGAWTPRALTVDQLDLVATIAEHILPEAGAVRELRHAPVPGRFEGCVPLDQIGRAWAV